MTIDKETLIKHRFWIALGVFVALWLVGVILIPTVQGSNNAVVEKKYQDTIKQVEAIKSPKSPHYRKPLEEKEEELKKHKNVVWEKAYAPQADLMTWPEGGNARLSERLRDASFGDRIASNDRTEYGAKLYQQYLDSLHLPEMVKPVEFDRGWLEIIRPVGEWDVNRTPTEEEIWLAQEDLWVKRELLSIIRETLDSVRIFHKPKVDPAKDSNATPAKGAAEPLVVRNANWELSLVLESDPKNGGGMVISTESTLKNINPWKRTLTLADVPFRIRQGEGKNYFDFYVNVDSVPANETIKFPKPIPFKIQTIPGQELTVEQVLTWQTSPIKRIDRIALGYNSHRTANHGLKAKQIGPLSEDDKKDKAAETTPSTSTTTQAMMGGGSLLAGGGATAGSGKPINKYLQRERYLDFTAQVRWMPVGMVLIVDQEYMQDVQVAIANSRLRIQPTQIAYHRAHGIHSAVARDGKTGDTSSGPVIGEGILGGGSSKGGRSSLPIPGAGGGTPAGPISSATSSEEDPNLVEFSIYGIASLYERYPPKQAASKP